MKKHLTHGSLFSGMGGFNEGATRAGIKNIFDVEIEEYQKKLLKRYSTQIYGDIKNTTGLQYVDIISGGFPCQDISTSGRMEGITGERSGLWTEMHRICREIRPLYIIIENSPMLTIRGLEKILCDLSKIGYNAEWQCLSNLSFGYPTTRERIYIIAYSNQIGKPQQLEVGNEITSTFKRYIPNRSHGYSLCKGIYALANVEHLRNVDRVQYRPQRAACIGNAVNPTIAHYLFDCVLNHYNTI